MCILPNFTMRDLATFKQNRKKEMEKAEAETVEISIAEQALLENSI
jgi:hypothetical protein